jgi:hypothetical protein
MLQDGMADKKVLAKRLSWCDAELSRSAPNVVGCGNTSPVHRQS